jgi:hypothetical protein
MKNPGFATDPKNVPSAYEAGMLMFFWVWAPCGLSGRSHHFGVSPLARLQSLPHSVTIGPFLQTSLPDTLYNPSILSMVTSAMKMEAVRFSETLASTDQSTRRPNPEEHHQYCHRRENLKSHKAGMFTVALPALAVVKWLPIFCVPRDHVP